MWKKSQASSTSRRRRRRAAARSSACVVAVVELRDQLFLGRVVVVEVARADAELGRDQRRRDVRLAEAVEELERGVEDPLGGAPRFLRSGGHGWGSRGQHASTRRPVLSHRLAPYNRGLHAGHLVRQRRQDVRLGARRRARPRRRELRHRGGRVLRPARAERRRQDDADLHPRRPGARQRRAASPCSATTSSATTRAARRAIGIVPQEIVFDPFFTVRETLRDPGAATSASAPTTPGSTSCSRNLGLADKARRQHAPALGRHEAARAGGAGAGAPAAGDRPRRADRRRRRRAAPDALAVRRPPERRRPHGPADHALPRGGRGALLAHRDAEAGQGRRARPHVGAAGRNGEHDAALQARQAAAAGACRANARVTGASSRSRRTTRARSSRSSPCCTRPAASPRTSRSAAPTSRTCSSRSCAARRRSGSRHERAGRGHRTDRERRDRRPRRHAHAALQGSAALLEGELPDRRRAGAHGDPLPAHLRPRRSRAASPSSARSATPVPDPGPGDDERAAERVRQLELVADPEQDHRQPRLPAASRRSPTGRGSSPTSALRSFAASPSAAAFSSRRSGSRRCMSPTRSGSSSSPSPARP